MIIHFHSVADVITNSSESIYVATKQAALTTIQELIDRLLKIGGSEMKATDLFDFRIEYPQMLDYRRDKIVCLHSKEFDNLRYEESEKLYDKYLEQYEKERPEWWDSDDAFSDWLEDFESYCDSSLVVTAKVFNKDTEMVAHILSNLRDLFDVNASYNG